MGAESFTVGFVPGVTVTKWSRAWSERRPDTPLELVEVDAADPLAALADGRVDMVLARLPLDTDGLHAIPLYEERAVAVVSKDHALAALAPDEEAVLADLADEVRHDLALAPADAVSVAAAGSGVALLPQSLARLHAQKATTYRFVADAPATTIALLWPADRDDDDTDDFVGVVRGRTARSSRGRSRDDEPEAGPRGRAARPGASGTARPAKGDGARGASGRGAPKGARGGRPGRSSGGGAAGRGRPRRSR